MFHDEKVEKIAALLAMRPYWKSVELAENLGISKSTVQRCLKELDERGVAERIHGGIRRKNHSGLMPVSVDERSTTDVAAKERIAEVAVQFVPESGYVYFDAGTTILPLVHAWLKAGKHTCTAVTNDVAIAVVLAQHGAEHILLTGKIHPVTQSLSGAASQNQLGDFRFAACFISADGIERNGAVRCALAEEAMLKRLAIKNSDSRILLGASSKWDKQSNALIATLDAFDMWITETGTQDIKKSGT